MHIMINDLFESKPYEKYAIYALGSLPCGSRCLIELTDIEIYTEIMVPENMTQSELRSRITSIIKRNPKAIYKEARCISLRRIDRFEEAPCDWVRYTFDKISDRRAFISAIESHNKASGAPFLCSSNDADYLHLVTRSYNIPTADWAIVQNYKPSNRIERRVNPNISYYITTQINNLKKLTKADRAAQKISKFADIYDKDLTMVCQWDIETYFNHPSGRPPRADDEGWKIHIVCLSFFWHWSTEPLLEVCITDREVLPDPARSIGLIIYCPSQAEIIRSIAHVWGCMGPEYLSAYNGINFDTPLVTELAKRSTLDVGGNSVNGVTFIADKLAAVKLASKPEDILKWNYIADRKVKINADNSLEIKLSSRLPGVIDTDVMITFMKLDSKAEVVLTKGLNYFLNANGLPPKEDMEIKRMFAIFRRSYALDASPRGCHCSPVIECLGCAHYEEIIDGPTNPCIGPSARCCACAKREQNQKDMFEVAWYCNKDCMRPQQLCVKRSIVPDKRALADMARVHIWSAYYQADGMKVQNLIGKYATKFGYAFNNGRVKKEKSEKDHNPGAYVF
jgi:DNA polymerase elongation subunit (family B)